MARPSIAKFRRGGRGVGAAGGETFTHMAGGAQGIAHVVQAVGSSSAVALDAFLHLLQSCHRRTTQRRTRRIDGWRPRRCGLRVLLAVRASLASPRRYSRRPRPTPPRRLHVQSSTGFRLPSETSRGSSNSWSTQPLSKRAMGFAGRSGIWRRPSMPCPVGLAQHEARPLV